MFRSGLAVLPLSLGMAGVTGGLIYMTALPNAFLVNADYQSAYVAICVFTEVVLFATGIWVYRGYLKMEGKPFGLRALGFAIGTQLLMFLLYPYMQIRINDRLVLQAKTVS
jgi:hypothetical protein